MHDVLSKACKQFDPQERFYTIHQSIITFQSHIHFFLYLATENAMNAHIYTSKVIYLSNAEYVSS